MADPVPVVDAALLAAQARAGQAGVDAYKAAQNELVKQRQSSVELAMQEAALRGSPDGAMQQMQSTATAPYDQRIASLSQASAAYQGDMAARDRRMVDYNGAVNAARSYIPQVTEQMVAPIRAEGDYRVRSIERGGEAKVSEIEANLRLTEAKMAAAFQAAQIAAAKAAADAAAKAAKDDKMPSLNKTELESELFGRAKQRLQQSSSAVRNIVEANNREVKEKVTATAADLRGGASGITARSRTASNARANDAAAARYMARGVYELQRQQTENITNGPQPGQPVRIPVTYGTGMGGAGGVSIPITPQVPPPTPTRNEAEIKRTQDAIAKLQRGITTSMQNQGRLEMDYARQIGSKQGYEERARSVTDPTTGRQIRMTPAQLSMFDAFDRDSILGATQYGSLNTGTDVDQLMLGAPGERGVSSPYSAQLIRNAMIQVAQEMVDDGYEISDAELRNALGEAESYRPGQSLYDSLARETGQPTGEEEYANAEDDEADRRRDENYDWTQQGREGEILDAESDVDQDSAEADARAAIMARYGYMPQGNFGNAIELANRIQSDNFQNSEQKLAEIFDQRGKDYIDDEIEEAMHSVGIPAQDVALLKEFYPG